VPRVSLPLDKSITTHLPQGDLLGSPGITDRVGG
jgi:hypothetical protein